MRVSLIHIFVLFIIYDGLSQDCVSDFLFNTVGYYSFGLAKDQDYFWVSDNNDNFDASEINIYDETGTYIETILDDEGYNNAVSCLELVNDTLWAVREQSSELLKLNKMTGELYAVYDLPSFDSEESNNTGVAYDGMYIWNSESFSPLGTNLFKIDPLNGIILDTVNISLNRLMPLEFVNGRLLGITVDDDKIYEINPNTGEITYLLDWCIDSPFDLTYNVDEGIMYGISISSGSSSVNKIEGLRFLTDTKLTQFIDEKTIDVYPNPVKDVLKIYSSIIDDFELLILNSIGEIYFKGSVTGDLIEKNVINYPPGVYYLLTENKRGRTMNIFVKI